MKQPFARAYRGRWVAAAAGAALPLTFAPAGWYLLTPILLAVLFWLWRDCDGRESAWRSFCFGFGAFATGTYWIYISVSGFAGAPGWLGGIMMLAMFAANAAVIAAGGYAAALAAPASPLLRGFLVWPAAWTLAEWVRSWVFTGFPWLSLGYAQIDGPLSAWAPLGGVYAVTFLTAVVAGVLLVLLRGANRESLIAFVLSAALVGATAAVRDRAWTERIDEPLKVSLIQGSVTQDKKWQREQLRPTLDLYTQLTFDLPDTALVIWPEVAVPAMAHQVQAWLDSVDELARARDMQLYIGILTFDFATEQFSNSLIGLGRDDSEYHKRHLVPFGEFFPVPGFVRELMKMAGLPSQDAARGLRDQPPLRNGKLLLAPSICYEDVFGAEQLDFLPQSQLLVNVSNDAWFGDSVAAHQHLQMARMRSLETGRYMLRSTNTGITAIIAPNGSIQSQLPQFEPGALSTVVYPHRGSTPFIRFGNYPVVILCFAILVIATIVKRRASHGSL